MAQGQDRIASSLLELQPTAIIELFLLYFNTVDNPSAFIAFHGGSVYNKGVVWQGIEYLPIPVETDGFEVNANGQLPRPKMRISNKDYFATDLLINNEDLQFAKIIRKRTFVKYLDDINFDGGNPWGQADASAELSNDTFVIGQKTAENKSFIELELTSPLDLENFEINNRLVMSRYCSWYYRGNGCNYRGIPIATEDGEMLGVSDPEDWFKNQANKAWSIQKVYNSGDASYIENQKIIVSDPSSPSQTGFAKIWYVCQSGHSGSSLTMPDKNQSLWKRDGCNKKLDGCKLRFGKGVIEFNEITQQRTAYFADFSLTSGVYNNNVARVPQSKLTVSASSQSDAYPAINVINGIFYTGSDSYWKATGTSPTNGVLTLDWSGSQNINRIDIYDNPDTKNINFGSAYIRLFNSANSVIRSGTLTIPTDGTRATTGFANTLVKKIIISGSGGKGAPSLSEVAVFEANTPHLVYYDQESIPLHRNDFFQISTWVGLTGSIYTNPFAQSTLSTLNPYTIYSILQNISGNCRYSGINLYISGSNLLLDFATRTTGAAAQEVNRTLSIPWQNGDLRPLHLICSGGSAEGLVASGATPGYIELSDGISQTSRYALSESIGEYFRFKNINYQNGIVNSPYRLKFGLNDWQFPTGNEFTPNPPLADSIFGSDTIVFSNTKVVSPARFGPTAFWTGASGVNVRIEESSQSVFKDYTDFTGRSSNTSYLLGWWEMGINDGVSGISAMNDAAKKLIISGDSPSNFNKSGVGNVKVTQILNQPKQSVALPFGGFPGTEKYG